MALEVNQVSESWFAFLLPNHLC